MAAIARVVFAGNPSFPLAIVKTASGEMLVGILVAHNPLACELGYPAVLNTKGKEMGITDYEVPTASVHLHGPLSICEEEVLTREFSQLLSEKYTAYIRSRPDRFKELEEIEASDFVVMKGKGGLS